MHTIDDLSLEILREVLLLPFRFRRLVQFLHEIEVLHLWSFHSSQLVKALGDFAHFDQLIRCWKDGYSTVT